MKKLSLFMLCLLLPSFANADQSHNMLNQTQAAPIMTKDEAIQTIQSASLRGDYPTAEKLLVDYQRQYGEDTQYLTEKARYFALNGNPQEALKMVEPLLKKAPTNSALLDIKNYALAHPNTVVSTSNPEFKQISSDVTTADAAVAIGNYKVAITLYQQALGKNPNDKAALIGLSRTYLFMEDYKAAEISLWRYKVKFGVDDQYSTEKARDFAFTDHLHQSLILLAPLLKKDPTNDVLLDIKKYVTDRLKVLKTTTVKATSTIKISSLELAKTKAAFALQQRTNGNAYAVAAKAYLDADDAKSALTMVNEALNLSPANRNYLLLKADIANRLDDQAITYKTYTQLYAIDPSNPKVILGLARAASRLNKLDQAVDLYHLYTWLFPNDKTAWLEYAYVQSWRGDDRDAISVLDEYHRRFGDSDVYLAERARILASATRFTESFAIVDTLLPRLPKNYDLNFAKTTDFYYSNQPIKMFRSYPAVNKLRPGTEETTGLWSFIHTPYRSNVGLDGYYSTDTDTVKISHIQLNGQYFLTPETSLLANVTPERLSASTSSGLNPIEGGNALNLYGYNVGVNHRINSRLALQGFIGGQNASDGEKSFNYEADALTNPGETLSINLQLKRGFYDQSPRAVSRGVKQDLGQVLMNWQPCIQCNLAINGAYATFTDGNTMRWIEAHPSAQIISIEKFNVNVGVDGQFYKFGKQLSDGYYNPANYKYGAIITDIYYKYSDNIGYAFALGLGSQRDETFTTWRPANDYSLKAYYGIYQDWYLVLSGGLSTRGRSIANGGSNSTYKVYGFDATITRRLD